MERRLVSCFVGIVLPWPLLAQLLGTLLLDRSWPDGTSGTFISGTALIAIILLTSALARSEQSPALKILGLQVLTDAGRPATRCRLLVRNAALIVDIATFGIGFLNALWDAKGRTFADILAGTTVRRVPLRS